MAVFDVYIRRQSSTRSLASECFVDSFRSLIKAKKSSDPRTVPCGSLRSRSASEDFVLLRGLSAFCGSGRIQSNAVLSSAHRSSQVMEDLRRVTLSKVLAKSSRMTPLGHGTCYLLYCCDELGFIGPSGSKTMLVVSACQYGVSLSCAQCALVLYRRQK